MTIYMATWSGKTLTVGEYLRKLYLQRNKFEKLFKKEMPIRILVLNDRINQVNQLETDLIEGRDGKKPFLWSDIKKHATIKLFHSQWDSTGNIKVKDETEVSWTGKDLVYFSSFWSTGRFAEEDVAWDFIIVDEAHHLGAETYNAALKKEIERSEKANGRTPLIIPMTATLDPIRHLVNDPVVDYGLAEYIASPYSPKIEYTLVTAADFPPEKLSDIYQQIQEIGAMTDFREKKKYIEELKFYIEEHLAKFWGLSDLVGDLIERLDSIDHTIIFANSIGEVDKITDEINRQTGNKNTAVWLHSKIDEADEDVLNDYKTGKKKVIVAVDKLNEGIDLPYTKNVVFWRDVKSPTVFKQQFGRGLRGDLVKYYDYVWVLRNMAWIQDINKEIESLPEEVVEVKISDDEEKEEWEKRPRKGIEVLFSTVQKGAISHEVSVADVVGKLKKIEDENNMLTYEETLAYIKNKFPTVELFDEMKINDEGWRRFYVPWVWWAMALGKKLGFQWVDMFWLEGKLFVRKLVYPEAEEIKDLSKNEIIEYIRKKFPTVNVFDELNVSRWNNSRLNFSIPGVWKPRNIGIKLWITWVNMQGSEWKLIVRKLVYPDAQKMEQLFREKVIQYIIQRFPTVESFDAMKIDGWDNCWIKLVVPWIWWVITMWTKLWIVGLEMWTAEGKYAIRKLVYPEAQEVKELSKDETIAYIRSRFPLVKQFDEIKLNQWGWIKFNVPWVWWVIKIGKKLWITEIDMEKWAWKLAVRKIVYPWDATLVIPEKTEIIAYIRKQFTTAESFGSMNAKERLKFTIPWVWGTTNIGKKLGIAWVNMTQLKGRDLIMEIVFPV